jgi:DNA invertase Pin-like site-specific DNA recombinase
MTPPAPPARVIAYLRTAPGRDDAEAQLAEQRRLIGEAAVDHGWTVEREYVDTDDWGSLPLGEREAGKELLADLRQGDMVMATALDRVFGDYAAALAMIETLRTQGARLYLLDLGELTDNELASRVLSAFQ